MQQEETTSNIIIKRIDSPLLLRVCSSLLKEVYNAEPWNDNWTEEKALEKLECFYNSPRFFGYMALQEEKILGCCVGNMEPYYTGDYFYLKEMFVSVHAQRKGIGQQLLNHLKKQLEQLTIHQIILFTSRSMFPFHFYQKTGFTVMEDMCMMHFEQSQ